MHFCSKCGNMYYIRLSTDDQTQLIYYCRKCGNENTTITEDNVVVSKKIIVKKEQRFNHIINKYTKLDPTLPRITNIKCPNRDCQSNEEDTDVKNEIIYMRYDDTNMKYVYICVNCDTIWKNNEMN